MDVMDIFRQFDSLRISITLRKRLYSNNILAVIRQLPIRSFKRHGCHGYI